MPLECLISSEDVPKIQVKESRSASTDRQLGIKHSTESRISFLSSVNSKLHVACFWDPMVLFEIHLLCVCKPKTL